MTLTLREVLDRLEQGKIAEGYCKAIEEMVDTVIALEDKGDFGFKQVLTALKEKIDKVETKEGTNE